MTDVTADANQVIDRLAAQIATLSKQVAILQAQLSAALKRIPDDGTAED